MTLVRPAAALSAAVLLGLTVSASAAPKAPKPVSITDAKGDANAVNDQGQATLKGRVPTQVTPAQVSGADILALSYQTTVTVKKVKGKQVNMPTGLKVVMTLAAPPQTSVIFRAHTCRRPVHHLLVELLEAGGQLQ